MGLTLFAKAMLSIPALVFLAVERFFFVVNLIIYVMKYLGTSSKGVSFLHIFVNMPRFQSPKPYVRISF